MPRALAPATGGDLLLAPGVSGQELDHGLTDAVEIRSELLQHLSGDAFTLTDQPEQDVLGADVVVSELECLAERQLQDLLGTRGERDVTGGGCLPLADDLFDLLADGLQRDVQGFECLRSDALALVDQAEEDVLGADVVVVEHPRFFLRENHDAPGAIRESLEHLTRPPGRGPLPLLAARGSRDHVLPPRYIGRRGRVPSARTDRVYPCPYEPLEPPSVANTLSFLRFVSASGLVPPHVERPNPGCPDGTREKSLRPVMRSPLAPGRLQPRGPACRTPPEGGRAWTWTSMTLTRWEACVCSSSTTIKPSGTP